MSVSSRVVILGAGRPFRADTPSALVLIGDERRVLDWQLEAFGVLGEVALHFVSGFRAEAFLGKFSNVDFIYNPRWERTGPAHSLSLAPLHVNDALFVSYSDVMFRPETLEKMQVTAADLVVAVDSGWRARYDARTSGDLEQSEKVRSTGASVQEVGQQVEFSRATAEFCGLVKFSSAATDVLAESIAGGEVRPNHGIPAIINLLLARGFNAQAIDVNGDWAELNAAQDLARFVLGTKAESLARVKPMVREAIVDPLLAFSTQEWEAEPDSILEKIKNTFPEASLIVRSSALSEDQWGSSGAGAYESVLNVDGTHPTQLRQAIETVLESYRSKSPKDQVLIQEMLTQVDVSGVILTRTSSLLGPYFVINYDSISKRTDTVTAGIGDTLRTLFVHRDSEFGNGLDSRFEQLLTAVRELEALVGHDSLDIEFAITTDGMVHILQVRPIAAASSNQPVSDEIVKESISVMQEQFEALQCPQPFILGEHTQLSVMTDWNPAEIIGTKPRQLALSLYRLLVTDEVWARQRAEFGYRDVRPCNLLVDLEGHPYVDVRASFNSFVPAELPEATGRKLVSEYLRQLREAPHLHDKVEFEILFTCLTVDFAEQASGRLGDALSHQEIAALGAALQRITRNAIENCQKYWADLQTFSDRYQRIVAADLEPLELAHALLDDARRIGVPIFAHLAREGFIAVSLLRSLSRAGALGEQGEARFMESLHTSSRAIQSDGRRVATGELPFEAFTQKYGHLRPGTYDITSPCYAADPEAYLRSFVKDRAPGGRAEPPWSADTCRTVSRELERVGLCDDIEIFLPFLRKAIEGREHAKFVFTRNLSGALEAIAEFGKENGFTREDLAHLHLRDLGEFRLHTGNSMRSILAERVEAGRARFQKTQIIRLPGQIFSAQDICAFSMLAAAPNFVTMRTVRAETVQLTAASSPSSPLSGRIAAIPNADPGFDWLFSKDIVGLITMYGGSNSHMAIRAAEFGLPAAIGVGDVLFQRLGEAAVIELDCASQTIRVVR